MKGVCVFFGMILVITGQLMAEEHEEFEVVAFNFYDSVYVAPIALGEKASVEIDECAHATLALEDDGAAELVCNTQDGETVTLTGMHSAVFLCSECTASYIIWDGQYSAKAQGVEHNVVRSAGESHRRGALIINRGVNGNIYVYFDAQNAMQRAGITLTDEVLTATNGATLDLTESTETKIWMEEGELTFEITDKHWFITKYRFQDGSFVQVR